MKEAFKYIFLFLISFLFILIASYSTSILYKYSPGYDSSMYITIGKYWNQGVIPYIGLFDHKGPLIFFINMIGYRLSNNSLGIMFLQVLSLFFTLIIFYKISRLYDKNNIILILITLLVLGIYYSEGNLTEEWCLPFISLCFYLNLLYLKNNNLKHKYLFSLIYGISLSICFLTKLSNGISIVIGIAFIYFLLLKRKEYKNLIFNILFFILGFLILFIPFFIYFVLNKAGYNFLDATLLFNIKYFLHHNSSNFSYYGNYLLFSIPTISLIILSIIKIRSNIKYVYYLVMSIIVLLFLLLSGNYLHYGIILLPIYLLLFIELYNIRYRLLLIFFIVPLLGIYVIGNNFTYYSNNYKDELYYMDYINIIPKNERKYFIGYNTRCSIYLNSNIKPIYNYFVLQDWNSTISDERRTDIYDTFNSLKAKWILIEDEKKDIYIRKIIDEKYKLVKKGCNDFRCYNLYRIDN